MGSHVADSMVGFSWAAQNKLQARKGERVKAKIKRKKGRPRPSNIQTKKKKT